VQVRNKYYFPDGARAFTDRGTRLTTASENTEVVRSLMLIAQARGWDEVTVRGTERFRREAWFAGHMAGIEVRGYKPTEFERGRLVRTLNRQQPGPTEDSVTPGEKPAPAEAEKPARRRDELLTGRLVDHGPAPYHHDPRHPMSYFVKLETGRGDRTIWGVDLERAFRESLTKPAIGDEVGLRSVRQDAVKVRTQERDADGKHIERDLETHRNRWIIEQRSFFEARAEAARTVRDTSIDPKRAVKKHPELVGTYLQVHAAELAAKRFRDPQDRERFVEKVRSALADSVARGEPLPAVRLRERAAGRTPRPPEREPAPARG
jgi:putative DNA primase/helicase